jgi:hypothetical protein
MSKRDRNNKERDAAELFWQFPAEKAAVKLASWCERIIHANMGFSARAYRYSCAYDGVNLTSIVGPNIDYHDEIYDGAQVPVVKNTVRRLCGSFISKSFADDSPCPQMVSTDGTFAQRLAAESIDDVLMAEFELPQGMFANIHEMHRHGGLLATCATGWYWIFAFPGEGRVEAELDDGLTIGMVKAGQYGQILTLCRTIWRDPEWLCNRYPDHEADIMAQVETVQDGMRYAEPRLGPTQISRMGTRNLLRRLVRIHQGWRVQIGDKPGREMFVLKNGKVLEDNPWEHEGPPGKEWCYERDLNGDRGVPLTQTIYRMFLREQEMIYDMDRNEHATPQVQYLVQAGTGDAASVKSQMSAAVGTSIIEVPGNPGDAIKVVDNTGLKRAGIQLSEMYDQWQYDITGVSKNQAYGTGQTGTSSGVQEAYRASFYTEIFAEQERRLIQFRAVDTARIFIWALQRVVEGKYLRWVGDKRKRRQITSKDLDLDESKYTLQIKPASEEKDSPKARLEKAEKMLSDPAGRFTGRDLVETWKTFDVDHAVEQAYKIDEWVEEQCDRWLRSSPDQISQEGWYQSPAKWMQDEGLKSALRICSYNYLTARQEGAPLPRLQIFERFMDECVELIDQLAQRAADIQAQAAGKAAPALAPMTGGPNDGQGGGPPGPAGGAPGGGPIPAG